MRKGNRDVDAETYVAAIGPSARIAMLKTGIPASFLIADACLASNFGSLKITTLHAYERPTMVEPWLCKWENRWTYMLNRARGIKGQYKLKGQQTPLALLLFLQGRGYFRSAPDDAAKVAQFIRNGCFSEWDTFDVRIARSLKRRWGILATVAEVRSLLKQRGLSNKVLIQNLQAAAA